MKRSDQVGSLGKNTPLPKNRYSLQCMEETFETSSKGNLMIKRVWQLIAPQYVEVGGQKIDVLGQEFQQYLTTKCFKKDSEGADVPDEEKTKSMMNRVFDDFSVLGLPCDEIDESNPLLGAKGIVADAICGSEEFTQTKDPTPEQVQRGQKYGDPILDANDRPIKGFKPKLISLLALSNVPPIAA